MSSTGIRRDMSDDRTRTIEELFQSALDLPVEGRAAFLDVACFDPGYRTEVEALLRHFDSAQGQFLQEPLPRNSSSHESAAVLPSLVGRFRIVRKIAEGGMGTVFEAEQAQPRRRVALKVIRKAMASDSFRRRFEHEVEILGQLRHPGIAQVYEAGTHDDGTGTVPYFAMEYVDGQPLLEFVEHHALSVRQRLRLMLAICDAVHHAHENGVIHRDLKPANVLVEHSEDGDHRPKVLDFGVARAIREDVESATMHTEVGQLLGTLTYMSPEQVSGRSDELDSRSDVYTLGLILYEILAKRLPYNLRDCSVPEVSQIICEQEASRLSSIDTSLRGDIETIVAKALSKEKERRYASAAEFGDDIRRFLNDEPIRARPASPAYQLQKFAKRNKGLVGAVAAAFAVLILGVVGISLALVRATRAERDAIRSATKANAVSKFLQNMLAGVDPEDIGRNALTVREVLDHATARLERELKDEPDVSASLHRTLGNHYSTLGYYNDADHHFRRAVELRRSMSAGGEAELADALIDLSSNLQEKRDVAEAEAFSREALELRRRLFGEKSPEVAESLFDLASVLVELRRVDEAEPLIRTSLDIRHKLSGGQNAGVARCMGLLGWCLQRQGRFDEAESAVRDAVDIVRRLPGDNELDLAARLTFLSVVLRARGKLHEEEVAVREAIEIRSRRLTPDHPSLAWNLLCLARIRWEAGDFDEAESTCRRALEIYEKKRGPAHTDIADCKQQLAQIQDSKHRFSEAEHWWRACLDMRRALLPVQHVDIVLAENGLAKCIAAQRVVPRTSELPANPDVRDRDSSKLMP